MAFFISQMSSVDIFRAFALDFINDSFGRIAAITANGTLPAFVKLYWAVASDPRQAKTEIWKFNLAITRAFLPFAVPREDAPDRRDV